eukprot:63442-Rhodomonas_salina.1
MQVWSVGSSERVEWARKEAESRHVAEKAKAKVIHTRPFRAVDAVDVVDGTPKIKHKKPHCSVNAVAVVVDSSCCCCFFSCLFSFVLVLRVLLVPLLVLLLVPLRTRVQMMTKKNTCCCPSDHRHRRLSLASGRGAGGGSTQSQGESSRPQHQPTQPQPVRTLRSEFKQKQPTCPVPSFALAMHGNRMTSMMFRSWSDLLWVSSGLIGLDLLV